MNINNIPHNYLTNPPVSMLEGLQANNIPDSLTQILPLKNFLVPQNKPGIYVLYNNTTFVSYIGETSNLDRRFTEHKTALIDSTHFNKNMRKSINVNNIDDLSFFLSWIMV